MLTFAGRPLYVAYLPTTAAWDISAGGSGTGRPPDVDPSQPYPFDHSWILFVAWLHTAESRAILTAAWRPEESKFNKTCPFVISSRF